MNDLDQALVEHYEQLGLSDERLAELEAMEQQALPEVTPPLAARRPRPVWKRAAWVAASLLGFVGAAGVITSLDLPVTPFGPAVDQDEPDHPVRQRLSIQEYNARRGDDGTVTVINGEQAAPVVPRPQPSPRPKTGNGYRRLPIEEYRSAQPEDGSLIIIRGSSKEEASVRTRDSIAPPDSYRRFTGPPVAADPPGRRSWVDTRLDPLSTFAADVDTASYTRARAQLERGMRPARSTVRAEEFVNAQHYAYPSPVEGLFATSVEGVPSVFDPDKTLIRIGLQARRVRPNLRKPVHLTFLVDVSGSMGGQMPLVRSGLSMLVQQLRPTDTVSIVTYAGSTQVLLRPTSGADKAALLEALETLRAGGSTAMGSGLDLAYEMARSTLTPGHENRVIIASDGDANVGATDPGALVAKLRAGADLGITLTTLSLGGSAQGDQVMETLANQGDGQSYAIADERDARRVLVEGLTGTLQTLARDVKLQVDFDPKVVKRWRQVGYDNRQVADRDFRNDAVDAGEIGVGHQMTALYEVEWVATPPIESAVRIGTLRLRYEAPGAERGEGLEESAVLSGPVHRTLSAASTNTRVAVVAAGFAAALHGGTMPSLTLLEDVLPIRAAYREQDEALLRALQNARRLK